MTRDPTLVGLQPVDDQLEQLPPCPPCPKCTHKHRLGDCALCDCDLCYNTWLANQHGLSDAQWRERARWIRSQPRTWAGLDCVPASHEEAEWLNRHTAANVWEWREHRGRA